MRKRLLALLLAVVTTLTLLPTMAAAQVDTGTFDEANVTWLGMQSDYQKTLDSMFPGGFRKIKAGTKWGIVDATGSFVAPPIYDKIELLYPEETDSLGFVVNEAYDPLGQIFIDGYTQCVRGGKMGLLNRYGEEAIPAQYDAVGLPSEGISRVIKKSGGTSYLGYWNLALGREIVAPNKYVVSGANATAAGAPLIRQMVDRSGALDDVLASVDKEVSYIGNRLMSQHDFYGGYAFVTNGKSDGNCLYGNIINTSGMEILPGGPYLYRPGTYPQFGPYMVYSKLSNQEYNSDYGSLGRYYMSGVVGPEGVVIPAQYTGGVRRPLRGHIVGDARMTVIPELKLVITAKDVRPGKEDGGKVGVVNFKNQTVIPFQHDYNFFLYKPEDKVFIGMDADSGDALYNAAGKRLGPTAFSGFGYQEDYQIVNGFAYVTKHVSDNGGTHVTGFVNVKTGESFFPPLKANAIRAISDFSKKGTGWVINPEGKWGLLNGKGQNVLPYQYDAVTLAASWTRSNNGVAVVNVGQKQGLVAADGKVLVPATYESLKDVGEYIIATMDGKSGLLSPTTGQEVMPCLYDAFSTANGAFTDFSLGAIPVRLGERNFGLVDVNGNLFPGTEGLRINKPTRGLFYTSNRNYIGPEGKVIFPDTLSYSGRKNFVLDDMTLVTKGGVVGYINADKLAKPTQPKAASPVRATASPSPTKLIVDGKSVSAGAYLIGGNNYVKLRDLAYLVNDTQKNFEVGWDGAKNAINLRSNTRYTTVAGDMAAAGAGAKAATRSSSSIYIDDLGRSLTAYTIGSNNYFKLRDVMRAFDIYVGWDQASGTATLDTSRGYELSAAEQAGLIPASGEIDAPPASQVNKLEVVKAPNLEFYMTGDHTFRTAGFELRYWDENGEPHMITDPDEMVFKIEGKIIEDGYVFTTSSMKEGTVGYNGLTAPLRFPVYLGSTPVEIDKVEGQTDAAIPDGKYTISCMGSKIGMSNGWMVLDSKKPVTFSVLKENDYYYIYYEDVTLNRYIDISTINKQLIYGKKFKWTITSLGDDKYSVRQYDKPEMVVNASGQQKTDGTKIIVYKHTNTPTNAILTFTPVK